MNSSERDEAERHCERLVLRAAQLSDQARWEDLVALFTPDAELVRPSDASKSIRGREAILASLRGRPPSTKRHVVTNVYVDVLSKTQARITSMATRYCGPVAPGGGGAAPGHEISIGHFEDDMILTDTGWAFRRRAGSMALEFTFPTKGE